MPESNKIEGTSVEDITLSAIEEKAIDIAWEEIQKAGGIEAYQKQQQEKA